MSQHKLNRLFTPLTNPLQAFHLPRVIRHGVMGMHRVPAATVAGGGRGDARFISLFLVVCLLTLSTWACSLAAPTTNVPGNEQNQSTQSSPSTTGESRGSGSFDLPAAGAGLASLDTYHATLKTSFTGTVSGVDSSWVKTYSLTVSKTQQARILSIADSSSSQDASLDGWITGQAVGLVYARFGTADPCTANFLTAENTPQVIELGQMLPPVSGAEVVKTDETLSGVAVTLYSFDERAVGMDGVGTAKGQVWIANDGGFVVMYSLQIQSDQGIYDFDQKGTMTWDYELDSIDQPVDIALPQDCPAGMSDLPLPDEASNGQKVPGYLSYTSDQSVADAADYYQQNLSAAGFEPQGTPLVNDHEAYLEFVNGSRTLTVQIVAGTPVTRSS